MYDLIIIGGGPAGYNAAERAAHGGLKTLLIEKKALGGVCLNEGCIPTKTLLYSAKIYDYAKHGEEYGVKFTGAEINHPFVIERKDKVVKTLVSGVAAKLKKAGVEVINGTAVVQNKAANGFNVIVGDDGNRPAGTTGGLPSAPAQNIYSSKYLLICSGSEAAIPPIPGLKEGLADNFCLTNREILDLKEIPKNLAVIGGGVIGLEMASYFNSIGVKVTVIEMLDKIGGPIDGEIADILYKNYAKKGIDFKLGAKVMAFGKNSVEFELNGEKIALNADKVLVSIGRKASSQNLGLENINVLTERGAIVTDDSGRTSVANVYAAGDVNGKSMLAHTAYREGEVCVNNILGKKDRINYNSIPAVIYTNPEVAAVGETTESVKQKCLKASVHSFTLKYSGRYVAENENGDGIVKIIVDENTRNIIGLHMIGSYASEIIYGAAMMIDTKMRVDDVRKIVFPHPTVGEVIREGCFMI
ncbi:MAG: dihydrolipoyl dehydrogenase [Oscillospiraceae bacterium]|nr:dihydrolipoyl dehydrogenase [Oscillospiraceae bacterium]